MRYVLLMLLTLCSGCVLNQPRNFVYNEFHTSAVSSVNNTTTTIKETPVPLPAPVIVRTTVTKNTTCQPFVLPPVGSLPIKPIFSDPELQAKTDIDGILIAHIKALEKYAELERDKIERKYREWLNSCK